MSNDVSIPLRDQSKSYRTPHVSSHVVTVHLADRMLGHITPSRPFRHGQLATELLTFLEDT